MNRGDLAKIIFSQGVITIFAVLLGFAKLQQAIAQFKTEKVYDLALERLRKQLCVTSTDHCTCLRPAHHRSP
jgi:hypothetical protein